MQRLNWDDLRLFLAIARAGRLVGAAKTLGLDHSTLARRLTLLEQAIGSRLVLRTPRGIHLTPSGQALLDHAERIEAEVIAAAEGVGGQDAQPSGTVRLATPEAFGTWLVAPHVARLHRAHPELRLELVPEPERVNLSNREADIAILFNRPEAGSLVARRLADYRLGLYASHAYAEANGPIAVDRLSDHPFAGYIDARIEMPELRFLAEVSAEARPVFRSTSIAAQHAAVAGGLGLGMLHAFAADADPRLVRLLPDRIEVQRSYWLAVHADQQRLPRIRAVIAFLDELIAEAKPRL